MQMRDEKGKEVLNFFFSLKPMPISHLCFTMENRKSLTSFSGNCYFSVNKRKQNRPFVNDESMLSNDRDTAVNTTSEGNISFHIFQLLRSSHLFSS